MTNQELETKLAVLVRDERKITQEIVELIREADQRRLYLECGFGSLFDWLVQGFGYSQSAAYRRIQAARLVNAVPEISAKIATGEVNLTTLAQAQTAIRQEEKRTGAKVAVEVKREILEKIEGKSSNETQKVLSEILSDAKPVTEFLRAINGEESRLSIVLEEEGLEALVRCKELLSHKMPEASWSEIVTYLSRAFVEKNDPARKAARAPNRSLENNATSAAVPQGATACGASAPSLSTATPRPSRVSIRRMVFARAGHVCEFVDLASGRRCSSRFRLEEDHVKPRGIGGTDDPTNLRALCRRHNQLAAERVFGREKMERYRRDPQNM